METLMDHDDCHNVALSNEKFLQAVSTGMVEKEEEEHNVNYNVNNVTMDTFFQSPVTTNTLRKIENVPN